MRSYLLPPILMSLVWSAFSIALALPLLRVIHRAFHLNDPPSNGLILLSFGLIICFLGAALIGMACGAFSDRNLNGLKLLAAFLGLGWSLAMALWMLPTYTGLVTDDLIRQSAVLVIKERGSIVPRAQSAIDSIKNNQINEVTRDTGNKVLATSKDFAVQGVSALPAMLIFGFALFGTPLVAFWECRRMQQ